MANNSFPHFFQATSADCGPTCLKIIAMYYGKTCSIDYLKTVADISVEGTTISGLCKAAEEIGFKSLAVKIPFNKLNEIQLPCIAHLQNNHYVVLYKIENHIVFISDPSKGLFTCSIDYFRNLSVLSDSKEIILMLFDLTQEFYSKGGYFF